MYVLVVKLYYFRMINVHIRTGWVMDNSPMTILKIPCRESLYVMDTSCQNLNRSHKLFYLPIYLPTYYASGSGMTATELQL